MVGLNPPPPRLEERTLPGAVLPRPASADETLLVARLVLARLSRRDVAALAAAAAYALLLVVHSY